MNNFRNFNPNNDDRSVSVYTDFVDYENHGDEEAPEAMIRVSMTHPPPKKYWWKLCCARKAEKPSPKKSKRPLGFARSSPAMASVPLHDGQIQNSASAPTVLRRARRTRIPNRPNISLSLWSVLKSSIGKDLSKIPMPVNFSEPLSMLQRLTEDFEYSDILDQAAVLTDSCEQLAYVAAFTVSSYASTAIRTGKPFNPLLGETYECDRMEDLGWRCINEQVSHHPPTAAQHCEGKNWTCWQQFTMSSKFRGNYIEICPLGMAHLTFNNSENHYTWRKVSTVVHNLILGKLWVDQEGEMSITNHFNGDICTLKYAPANTFSSDAKKLRVTGTVMNKEGKVQWVLNGCWDNKMEATKVISTGAKGDQQYGPTKLLWTKNDVPPDSEKYYFFSYLACQLNELEPNVAPTDSRLRPDQRLMENGQWDEANAEKSRLEEKQRQARKQRGGPLLPKKSSSKNITDEGEPNYNPAWFSVQIDPVTKTKIHSFTKEYWECKAKQDWTRCPDIF